MNKLRTVSRYFINALLAVVLLSQAAKAQSFGGIGFNTDCGTWKAKPIYYTEWQSVDTLKKEPIKDTVRSWVYDKENLMVSNQSLAIYCQCGCGYDTKWQQYRVCQITGIRQVRYKVQPYEYIPKPKSDYERAVDSLSKNNR